MDKIDDCASYQGQPKREAPIKDEKFTDLDIDNEEETCYKNNVYS